MTFVLKNLRQIVLLDIELMICLIQNNFEKGYF